MSADGCRKRSRPSTQREVVAEGECCCLLQHFSVSQHEHPNAHALAQGAWKKEHDPHHISVKVAEHGYLLAVVKVTEAMVAFEATGGGSDPADKDEVSSKAFAEELKGLGRCDTVPWIRYRHR